MVPVSTQLPVVRSIRMAELYLNLAECYAALDNEGEALANLNEIRRRAGISELTGSDVTGSMTLTDWVRNERSLTLERDTATMTCVVGQLLLRC